MDIRIAPAVQASNGALAKKGMWLGLAAGVLWGLDGVLMGINLTLEPFSNHISPLTVVLVGACIHDGFAGLWVLLTNLVNGGWQEYRRVLQTKKAGIVVLAGIMGGPVGMSANLLGIHLAGAGCAAAITAAYPAIGAILGAIFLKERIPLRVWVGILLSMLGAGMIGYLPPAGNVPAFYVGIGFSMLAAVGWALEGVISTYGMHAINPDIAVGIRKATSFLVFLIVIFPLLGEIPYQVLIEALTAKAFWYIAVTALAGAGSYLMWYRAMHLIGVGRAMSLNITYVLWAIFFEWLFSGLQLTIALFLGAVIIIIGTLFVVSNPEKSCYKLAHRAQ
ncbi:DMT family transporter [Sporomusa sp.]|uniref:DMT family transporter n=1 Tax=Sporomusa sp. TaxID=2078658 RepID=UPI002D7F436B|nr:EamA family transporter [Sporomusa sp.]